LKAVHILVSGRVQGVGFRWFTEREAERWAIAGYARNLADGSVEVRAQGDERALDGFCKELKRGPRAARIQELRVTPVAVDESLRRFSILF
jgi:acylphosphatase